MRKWIIGIIAVIIIAVSGKYAFSYLYNEWLTREYENGDYTNSAEPLFFLNCFESYIAHYNNGNMEYQKGNYIEAIEEYDKALSLNPPEKKECSIRVNKALAMIYNMGEDFASEEKLEQSISTLKDAREVLLAEGCAAEQGDGHSERAQKLKEEIDKLIEQLEEQKEKSDSSDDNKQDENKNQNNQQEQNKENSREEEIKQQLQQNQGQAHEEREQNMDLYEDDYGDINFEYEGIW